MRVCRVLFVNLEGAMAGAETSLLMMARALHPYCDVAVACPASGPLSVALAAYGIRSWALPVSPRASYRSPLRGVYWMRATGGLIRAVRTFRPEILHANTLYAGVLCPLVSAVTGTPFVLHIRDLGNVATFCRLCSSRARGVIAVSGAVRDALVRNGVRPDKVRLIHNIVAGEEPARRSFGWARLRPPDRPFVFASVGQFVPWKKQTLFLDAASRAAAQLPDCRFLVVGDDLFGRDGRYKQQIVRMARRSVAAGQIEFTGWVKDMELLWSRIDCLVHTADREAFGRVVAEAMAHRVPVVAVNAGGPAEIVRDGVTGLLVPGDDAKALAAAMLRIAKDPALAGNLATAGGEYAASTFTADATVRQLTALYREVLAA